MDWKEALGSLINIAPKLAFKPELIEQLKSHVKQKDPPTILPAQLEVMMAVAKQNTRVAQLHGYPGLESYAKQVEVAIQNVISGLRNAGIAPQKSAQAGLT